MGLRHFRGDEDSPLPRIIIFPESLLNEADALKYQYGIHDPFGLLTIDERVLCSTHYHRIASHLKELARKDNPRGTVGTGVGEAYRYSLRFPELIIRVRDLSRPDLKDLLIAIREKIIADLDSIIHKEFLPQDRDEAQKEIDLLHNDDYPDFILKRFREASKLAKIVDSDFLRHEILSKDGVSIVESSHGVLTDHFHGFHPHTTALRTLPRFNRKMLESEGYTGQVVNIGVTRAYQIRHGAGPMPTDDPMMAENLLPGSHKDNDRYQGNARVGPLDLVMLRYAIEVCGGKISFDGLAITWFDQIVKNGEWRICNHYNGADDQRYFTQSGEIKIRRGEDDAQLDYQEALGKKLLHCRPELMTFPLPHSADRNELFSFCAEILKEKVCIPVRMVSFGPTERDKVCK